MGRFFGNMRRMGAGALAVSMIMAGSSLSAVSAQDLTDASEQVEAAYDMEKEGDVGSILTATSLDDKISQMIMPAIRTWDEENVTDLSAAEETAEALRAHQYGGIILYGQNVEDSGQVATLVQDLQANNLANEDATVHIPYFMAADEEGGIVVRLSSGTRMNGSMAIGATGENAAANAEKTGRVIGEEMAAAGFNVDFAPDIDVNNNPENPVIGTRSFSDDPQTVAQLGIAWADGLADTGVIATYKHYPGHGDTGTDSHIGTPSVEKTYDQIMETELVPFEAAINNGADMIMTAHITYPLIDDEVVFGDGETTGFYPATMSKKMITDILRGDLGYDGVVVTDALEMGAISTAGLVPGEEGSVEYSVNIAQKVILAGVDILLVPTDLNCEEAVEFYDEYIDGLKAMVEDGSIPLERIDESVERILKLKDKYGILDAEQAVEDPDEAAERASEVLGSDAHHEVEMEIANEAVTLLKNDNDALPITQEDRKIVFLGRQIEDAYTIEYALGQLKEQGILDPDVQIVNLGIDDESGIDEVVSETAEEVSDTADALASDLDEAVSDTADALAPDLDEAVSDIAEPEEDDSDEEGTLTGENAGTISIDYYYDLAAEDNKLHYTQALEQAISEADVVIGFTKTYSLSALEEDSEQYQGIAAAIEDTHAAGGRFVLLSDNLPYDAARYQESDAIMLAYMGAGLDMDPTEHLEVSGTVGAYNANVVAAIHMMFGDGTPTGTLPVQIPEIVEEEDGSLAYSDKILYERGSSWETAADEDEAAADQAVRAIVYEEAFPSWNPDSESLNALIDFVSEATDEAGEGYIEPADRIAAFDMDGTLLCEKAPVYIDYCLTMYRVLDDPTYNATEEERIAMQETREHALCGEVYDPEGIDKNDLVASAFAGMTIDEFRSYVVDFADNTYVVGFEGMTYGQSFYKPMIEVINYLRDNDFDVWMVSACEREVVRAMMERFDIPYDHVIATDVPYVASGKGDEAADEYNMGKDEEILLGEPLDEVECGKSEKASAIAREIGKRPVLAFGNSSGDYSMLNYAEGNPDHHGMGFFVVCDDTEREYGNDEKAADYYDVVESEGWTAISMADDWKTIYGEGVKKTELPGLEEEPDKAA